MADDKRIHFIPPLPQKREKRVVIYCRVSTKSTERLKNISAQVSALTRLTAVNPKWLLVSRILQDCKSRDIEIILTKSISRFGRDTVEILEALYQPKILGIRVIFDQGSLDIANTDSDLMISIIQNLGELLFEIDVMKQPLYITMGRNPTMPPVPFAVC